LIIPIIQYLVYLAMVAIIWYYLGDLSNEFIDKMVSKYPASYPSQNIVFAKATVHWSLFFALLGLSYSLYVIAIRSKTPEGYYT